MPDKKVSQKALDNSIKTKLSQVLSRTLSHESVEEENLSRKASAADDLLKRCKHRQKETNEDFSAVSRALSYEALAPQDLSSKNNFLTNNSDHLKNSTDQQKKKDERYVTLSRTMSDKNVNQENKFREKSFSSSFQKNYIANSESYTNYSAAIDSEQLSKIQWLLSSHVLKQRYGNFDKTSAESSKISDNVSTENNPSVQDLFNVFQEDISLKQDNGTSEIMEGILKLFNDLDDTTSVDSSEQSSVSNAPLKSSDIKITNPKSTSEGKPTVMDRLNRISNLTRSRTFDHFRAPVSKLNVKIPPTTDWKEKKVFKSVGSLGQTSSLESKPERTLPDSFSENLQPTYASKALPNSSKTSFQPPDQDTILKDHLKMLVEVSSKLKDTLNSPSKPTPTVNIESKPLLDNHFQNMFPFASSTQKEMETKLNEEIPPLTLQMENSTDGSKHGGRDYQTRPKINDREVEVLLNHIDRFTTEVEHLTKSKDLTSDSEGKNRLAALKSHEKLNLLILQSLLQVKKIQKKTDGRKKKNNNNSNQPTKMSSTDISDDLKSLRLSLS